MFRFHPVIIALYLFVQPAQSEDLAAPEPVDLSTYCLSEMSKLPGAPGAKELKNLCSKVKLLPSCKSQKGLPIFHYDKEAKDSKGKNILVISLIHGDEFPSGSVSASWMNRLEGIDSRNAWRVIPIANPDGQRLKTRMNANGVDLNRNFPTEDWSELALIDWKTKRKADPRRYPGSSPASEPETKCLVDQIDEFKPDFIISIHTPYGVLDFDGPKVSFPRFHPLPWISLGHFPGSLGRYMWKERNIPVLTIELKGNAANEKLEKFDQLQDISGTVAIQSDKVLKKNEKPKTPKKEVSQNEG